MSISIAALMTEGTPACPPSTSRISRKPARPTETDSWHGDFRKLHSRIAAAGVMAYRAAPFNRNYGTASKTSHAGLNSWSGLLAITGIGVAIKHHHDSTIGSSSIYNVALPHFKSTHALLGLTVLLLIVIQIVCGLLKYFGRGGKHLPL